MIPSPQDAGYNPTPGTTTRRPLQDIDLPELPDFLKPDSTTKRPLRPINDIDLPNHMEIIHEQIPTDDTNGYK